VRSPRPSGGAYGESASARRRALASPFGDLPTGTSELGRVLGARPFSLGLSGKIAWRRFRAPATTSFRSLWAAQIICSTPARPPTCETGSGGRRAWVWWFILGEERAWLGRPLGGGGLAATLLSSGRDVALDAPLAQRAKIGNRASVIQAPVATCRFVAAAMLRHPPTASGTLEALLPPVQIRAFLAA
jgi:hypothetical protein